MAEQRTVWVSDTGAHFDTEAEAIADEFQHQLILGLNQFYEGEYFCTTQAAKWLSENYTMERKQ